MFTTLVLFLVKLYIMVIIADVVLSFFPNTHRYQPVMHVRRMADLTLNPLRKILPRNLPFDISPLILLLALNILLSL